MRGGRGRGWQRHTLGALAALAGALTSEMADTDRDLPGMRAKYGCGV